jgi:hypothetical protein
MLNFYDYQKRALVNGVEDSDDSAVEHSNYKYYPGAVAGELSVNGENENTAGPWPFRSSKIGVRNNYLPPTSLKGDARVEGVGTVGAIVLPYYLGGELAGFSVLALKGSGFYPSRFIDPPVIGPGGKDSFSCSFAVYFKINQTEYKLVVDKFEVDFAKSDL